jgi:hypothetical protein
MLNGGHSLALTLYPSLRHAIASKALRRHSKLSEEITGYRGFHPASEAYVVKDLYKLVNEGEPKLEVGNPAEGGNPGLNCATFTLIRSFEVSNEGEIKLKNVLIEGKFGVELKPDKALRVGLSDEGWATLNRKLPTVRITGTFKHSETKRRYKITIENAFVTQDFPGSFFRQPLASGEYAFIATHANIEMLRRETELTS